jgi:hypothetical protein
VEGFRSVNESGAQRALARFNAVMQPILDRIRTRYAGRPVDEVREELRRAWGANAGRALPEPQLSEWSTRLAAGERINLAALSRR